MPEIFFSLEAQKLPKNIFSKCHTLGTWVVVHLAKTHAPLVVLNL